MKKIEKAICVMFMSVMMIFCIAGCGGKEEETSTTGEAAADNITTEKVQQDTQQDDTNDKENKTEESQSDVADDTDKEAGSHILVAYFSATGTTKRLAKYAADICGADLYEIVPKEPYIEQKETFGK